MKRTLVIGDIHGGLKALIQVLQRAEVTKDDRLGFLGHLCMAGVNRPEVVDYVMELLREQECIFIKGNHDEWCEEWLRTGLADRRSAPAWRIRNDP